jgi:mannosyltransferase
MKIIFDNIIFSLQKGGGISVYWSEMLSRVKDDKRGFSVFESKNDNIFRLGLNLKHTDHEFFPVKILRYLPFTKWLPAKSIFHSSYYRISLQKNVANITTVHDFTYEYFKSGLPRVVHSWQKSFAIKNSAGIICVSENTRNDLLSFYPDVDQALIKVIYNGVSEDFHINPNASNLLERFFPDLINKRYLLFIGDRSAYKNFNVVVNVLKKLTNYYLVIVGGGRFSQKELDFIEEGNVRIKHFQGIDNVKLNTLYNKAFCLVYPSSYEGFGIPVLEAMRAGCPVISARLSSIPEVAGEAGLLIDSVSADEIMKKIIQLESNTFRDNIIRKGFVQSAKFSWDKCFNETFSFYKEIYDKKFK